MEDKKIDPAKMQIAASKMQADGSTYFKLFEKHIPRDLGLDNIVLLYKLDNLSCICKIISMNSKAHYVIVSNDAVSAALQVILDKAIDVKYVEELDFEATDMKFDCIIMNPPFKRNLHLKILAEAIKHLKDEKSVCVNLSPVRWLQDPLAKYKRNCVLKRFEESVAKHLTSVDVLLPKDMTDTFGAAFNTDIGIYCAKTNKLDKHFDYEHLANSQNKDADFTRLIFNKTYNKVKDGIGNHIMTFDKRTTKNYVFIVMIGGHIHRGTEQTVLSFVRTNYGCFVNDLNNGKTIIQLHKENPHATNGNPNSWPLVCFDTAEECKNFYDIACDKFYKFLCWSFSNDQHVNIDFLPWLGDAINPRTGLKGYRGEWTDDDLVLYFGITPEEQEEIERTMAKYAAK